MFIPRHPVVEDMFCSYAAQTATGAAGIGGVIAYAGSVVYLNGSAANQESEVDKLDYSAGEQLAFGFLMQKVKTGYHQVHPTGYYMPGDLGSSDVIAQPQYDSLSGAITGTKSAPVAVAHLGIWDTVHYVADGGATGTDSAYSNYVPVAPIVPGQKLYAAADQAKVTNSTAAPSGADFNGEASHANVIEVARVVRGASIPKITANCQNTALYPIRIKLLV